MLKTLRTALGSLFTPLLALYLAYVFSDVLLKGFIPTSWQHICFLLCVVTFFFVLRWLKTEGATQSNATQSRYFQGASMWDTSSAHLFQTKAFFALIKLLKSNHRPATEREQKEAGASCANNQVSRPRESCKIQNCTPPLQR